MEIQYLWIENYRSIEKQGFNFGSKYIFDFDFEKAELYCRENDQFIDNFFDLGTSNVTAFIGANGSGKTTILDFIKLNIAWDIGNTNLHYLCLFKEKGRDEIFVYNSTVKKLRLPEGKETLFKVTTKGRIEGKLISLSFPTAFIYYSSSIDYNFDRYYPGIDLSTTELLQESGVVKNMNRGDAFSELVHREIKMQMRFASQYKGILPFPLPEELHMNPHFLEDAQITSLMQVDDNLIPELSKWKKIIDDEIYSQRGDLIQVTTEIYKTLFWHSIRYLLKESLSDKILIILKSKSTDQLNVTWELLHSLYSDETLSLPKWHQVEIFFNMLKELESKKIMDYFFARFNFAIRPEGNFEKVDTLVKAYYDIAVVGAFLSFYWSGLSMGEQSLFSMFSRFYNARLEIKENFMSHINDCRVNVWGMSVFNEKPEVVILIDEGEVHMHPQWQKEFIYNLTHYLPAIIDMPKIQLILSSNSPFLISDLPNYNVVFLQSKENKTIVYKEQPTSFAANIHELLANSFFLDTPIGKLAENKIDEILKWLNQKEDLSPERVEYIHKVIRLVDDSVVQNKLLQLLALKIENVNWEQYILEQQREIIDQKLNKLKGKNT